MHHDRLTQLINSSKPILMGIINLTPDSFYGDGINNNQALIDKLNAFNSAGVDIIDIGAESSRPGASPISCQDEISRLSSGLAIVKEHSSAFISVDTYKAKTAEFALSNGASIINDISGGASDELLQSVAKYKAGIVLMHKQGEPKTMQNQPQYDDVIFEVKEHLHQQRQKARSFGITPIILDPGIGFGKTLTHNLQLLKHLDEFKSLECPLLIGTSNKSFIGELCNAEVNDRLPGSIASVLACYTKGARIFRVHNPRETQQAITVYKAIHE